MFERPPKLVNQIHHLWLTHGHFLTNAVAPPVCLLCGGEGRDGRDCNPPGAWGLDLCLHCERACAGVAGACPRCGQPSGGAACASCRAHPPPFDATFCLFAYQDPADRLVTQLKFQGQLAAARVLGMLFAAAVRASGRALPHCLVPLPSHATRHRERGFCQTTEIARHLAPRIHPAPLPVRTDLLLRTRATRVQSGLAAGERAGNLAGAFAVAAGRVMPERIALLDDVMTTGQTAAAAAHALKAAGCRRVEIWCCTRALRTHDDSALAEAAKAAGIRVLPA